MVLYCTVQWRAQGEFSFQDIEFQALCKADEDLNEEHAEENFVPNSKICGTKVNS
jgi:hypothetical protein